MKFACKSSSLISILFFLIVSHCVTITNGIDFGIPKIVGNFTSGVAGAAKDSVGAVASVATLPAKYISGSGDAKPSEAQVPTATTLKTIREDESDIASTGTTGEPGTEDVGVTATGDSWYKKPLDALTYIPNKAVEGAGEAWSTVSETVVNNDPAHSVKFYFYDDEKDLDSFKQIVVGQVDTLRSVEVPKDSRLNILIHGFMQDINSSFPQNLKDTLLLHTGTPVICVDWGHMADGKFGPEVARTLLYPFIVDNVAIVGEYVGEMIMFLKNNSVISSFDQVHVMGFSLGAHVSGIAGWTVQNKTGETLARITGLDPAGPKFFLRSKERRLNFDDAKFVDVIHTSHLGYFLQMGHVDFFPNGGKIQPGCVETESVTDTVVSLGSLLTGSCSHAKAWQFYLMSIKDNQLQGCECNNIFKYEITGCEVECKDKVPFGETTPSTARGNYFLSI